VSDISRKIEDILNGPAWRLARRSEVEGWISISVSRPPIWSGVDFEIEEPEGSNSVIAMAASWFSDRPALSELIQHVAEAPRGLEAPGLALELCGLVSAGLSDSPSGRAVPDLLAQYDVLSRHDADWIDRFANLLHSLRA